MISSDFVEDCINEAIAAGDDAFSDCDGMPFDDEDIQNIAYESSEEIRDSSMYDQICSIIVNNAAELINSRK